MISNPNMKQILLSIIVGACVAFLTTLFEGLADFIKTNSTDIVSGTVASAVYLAKAYKG